MLLASDIVIGTKLTIPKKMFSILKLKYSLGRLRSQ